MKYFLILFTSLLCYSVNAQVTGKIIEDGRKVTQEIAYRMEMKSDAKLVFDIAVNVKGEVTSCILNREESTARNTVLAYKGKNMILMDLKFEKGNGYPTFHHGQVTIKAQLPE
jgi:hypothetical protein